MGIGKAEEHDIICTSSVKPSCNVILWVLRKEGAHAALVCLNYASANERALSPQGKLQALCNDRTSNC